MWSERLRTMVPVMTKTQAAFCLLTGASVSATTAIVTYTLAVKKLESKYEKIAEAEIAEAKKFYTALHKTDDYSTPAKASKNLLDPAVTALRAYLGEQPDGKEPSSEEESSDEDDEDDPGDAVITKNIFDAVEEADPVVEPDEFDYEKEVLKRTPLVPYIITDDEFMNNESGYTQSTLTYFEGDDVLVDERDEPIPDIDKVVGNDNLDHFGYGSNDNRILYVRNDKLQLEFEIVKNQGEYTKEVLGFIEHSVHPGRRRFRGDDE